MKPRLIFIFIICLLTSLNLLAQTYAFIVDAKQEWQATGISINSGESFTITGRGTYSEGSGGAGGNPNAWASADGRGTAFPCVTGLLAPNVNASALIGKIGNNGDPFGIGGYLFSTATTSGELYLSINDKAGTFGDNFGYVVAIISVESVNNNYNNNLTFPPLEFPTIKFVSEGTSTFIVNTKQEWQSTGITINSGESFTITGRGTYTDGSGGLGGNPNAWATADGRGNGDMAGITGLLAPNFSFASLIGKIGSNGDPFGIGSYKLKTATTLGELYLSINDKAGTFGDNYGYVVAIISANTVTDINQDGELMGNPNEFILEQNYPNPFNPTTNIIFKITESMSVGLSIYNINGKKIKDLISNELFSAGNYTLVWDGTDNSSQHVSSGIYFYQLNSDNNLLTKKMILLR